MIILLSGNNLIFFLCESLCPLCSSWLEFTTESTKNTKIHKEQNGSLLALYYILRLSLGNRSSQQAEQFLFVDW